jgi:hypothetical protein
MAIFTKKLYWLNKYQPGIGGMNETTTLVSEKTNILGEKIQIAVGSVVSNPAATMLAEEIHVFRFFWEPQSVIVTLWRLWATSQSFTLPAEFGLGAVRFAKDNPIRAVPVVGEDFWNHEEIPAASYVDKYNGEIHVLATRTVGT